MINDIGNIIQMILAILPFVLLCFFSAAVNVEREIRSRQFPMPIVAAVYCVLSALIADKINTWLLLLIKNIPIWISKLSEQAGAAVGSVLDAVNWQYWMFYVANAVIILVYIIIKRILITVFKRTFAGGSSLHKSAVSAFYVYSQDHDAWGIKNHFGQARTFFKVMYYSSVLLSSALFLVSHRYMDRGLIEKPFYPVFGVLIIGELYFFLSGLTIGERGSITGEDEDGARVTNYSVLRKVLRGLFGDKLSAEDTNVNNSLNSALTNDEMIRELLLSEDGKVEAYGKYIRALNDTGFEPDQNYVYSALDLLNGKSILFNNPFYRDLIPYAFYPMNRTLLRRKKVLVVLGRHAIENDVKKWLADGITAVTNIPSMWRVGIMGDEEDGGSEDIDIGIITRSNVYNLKMHSANGSFFEQVEYVVIIEPSKLITTAQIGLNSIVKKCRAEEKNIVFCSCDKNCDGLVDALSHILMTSLSEVSATRKHLGTTSYMCWDSDETHLQHRLLPNISRYLGVGTELSFVALKNQVEKAVWYGGEAYPVTDQSWIDRQYYYDLLKYSGLPAEQNEMGTHFITVPELWSADVEKNSYMTVEDEAFNMFEVVRNFSTRATEQGFVNVISSEYLLKDYMADNEHIFETDPKAVPYIVADYARTERNVTLRLVLMLSSGSLSEERLIKELSLLGKKVSEVKPQLWGAIVRCYSSALKELSDENVLDETIDFDINGCAYSFDSSLIKRTEKFNLDKGVMETLYSIENRDFIRNVVSELKSAGYIVEDEKGQTHYLGAELVGHIFQRFLPGQFFTFDGKFYEMISVTGDNQLLARRAADHILGRPAYRQIRNYTIDCMKLSGEMGALRDVSGLKVYRGYADISVETPAYLRMHTYKDIEHSKTVTINGVPVREYKNKQLLKIELPSSNREIVYSMTVLLNEVFKTIFAENQAYICAVTAAEAKETDAVNPLTYSLNCRDAEDNCIYIIEDSRLDLGLLVAVERNINRIFEIICDYLEWHEQTLEKSLNPPPEPTPPTYSAPEGKGKKKLKLLARIKRFFAKIFGKIKAAFKKITKRIKKLMGRGDDFPDDDFSDDGSSDNLFRFRAGDDSEADPRDGGTAYEPDETTVTDETDETEAADEADEPYVADAAGETDEPDESDDTDVTDEPGGSGDEKEKTEALFSDIASRASFDPDGAVDADAEAGEGSGAGDLEFTVEEEEAKKPRSPFERKPYHERYFLLFGGSEIAESLDVSATREYLYGLGFDNSPLKQARRGQEIAEQIARTYDPNRKDAHFCDFCGVELVGTEYEVLADGRERCMHCGRTAVKTAEEFTKIFKDVLRNMETFYGVRINTGIKVEMTTTKKLAKRINKNFVPTSGFDARAVGVAIKDASGYTILIENGIPRLRAMMTIAHELTHIWQYMNWDRSQLTGAYGKDMISEVYEGMSKWVEIQYALLINEVATAKREEITTAARDDEYGRGFVKYLNKYPFSMGNHITKPTPFLDRSNPL